MANDVAKPESHAVPDWMRKASTGASLGNIDASDLKPPRLKVLAGQSPEVMDGLTGAVPGRFWMTILNQNLGESVTGTFILVRKSYQVWAPKDRDSGQKGPLATSSDGVHWDVPNQTFEVRFPMNPNVYKWRIGKLVSDFGATKWGSQQPEDSSSKPIATMSYDCLWVIDLPNGGKQLCVFTNSRTGVEPTRNVFSTMKAMGVDAFYQRYRISVVKKTGPTGDPYFTYQYQHVGFLDDEKECQAMRGLFDQYSKSGFIADHETEADEGKPKPFVAEAKEDVDEIPF